MKIAHIILTHSFAGSERHAVELANLQADAGNNVTIILHRRATENRSDAVIQHVSKKVKIEVVNGWRWLASHRVRKVLKRLKPDVAHAHLSLACKSLNNSSLNCLRVSTLHICYKPQQHRHLDALIAIAPWQLDEIPSNLREHSRQINNWSLAKSANKDARNALRKKYQISDDVVVFGTLGRVVKSKDHETLIEAFKLANIPNSKLILVGEGKNWSTIRQKADESIIMPGFSKTPENWLGCFDVFVSSAISEPFGLVFLEAMHANLPIVSTASQGALYLQNYFPYALSNVGDAKQLSERMKLAANDLKPIHYDMSDFCPEAKCKEVIDFYKSQLSNITEG